MSFNKFFLVALLLVGTALSVTAQVKLPRLIADGMVLQRDTDVRIWGWASNQEPLSICFLGKEYLAKASDTGAWSVSLGSLQAGGPYSMQIKGTTDSIELKDIYIGDVWLASGQSNMELTMDRVAPLYPQEIQSASNQEIRFFEVPKTFDFNQPREDLEYGQWKPVSPSNTGQFAAVPYFYAKNLYKAYKVPIGIINSALGGSPAEAWLSQGALKAFPQHYNELQRFKAPQTIDSIQRADKARINAWHTQAQQKDKGLLEDWKTRPLQDSLWDQMEIPGFWADTQMGYTNGVVWFKRDIDLSPDWQNVPAKLLLGTIVDADSVFVNGQFVGNTTYQYPPRRYAIAKDILKAGKNTITIRVTSEIGRGGFTPEKQYQLISDKGSVDLTGPWRFRLGTAMPRLEGQTFIRWKPGGLFNAMIHPLKNYSIKGALWYQGESNTDTPDEYQKLMAALIQDWRGQWKQPELPFLLVQLANFMEVKQRPGESQWARLRDAQLKTLSIPHTAMAVAIDIGEWNDIHPLNKKSVGDRLARAAKAVAYKEDILSGGPLYDSYKIQGDSIVISFKNVGKGLVARGADSLNHFAIAAKDRAFVWAKAEIRGDKIIVYHPKVKAPVAVRYGWADNPKSANLYNKQDLPASPFRTDNWE